MISISLFWVKFYFVFVQAFEQVEQLNAQILQERELRSVTESCLMEDGQAWQQVNVLSLDTRQRCAEVVETLHKTR